MTNIEVKLSDKTYSLLEELAKGEGLTIEGLVKKIIEVYVASIDIILAGLSERAKRRAA
ncbi:hypothetical protein KAU55_00715 [Candidatus Bathyarchaeota archaeon]|nr:hypothetical protein [Candidatus Bathyarchaeota archaeon]